MTRGSHPEWLRRAGRLVGGRPRLFGGIGIGIVAFVALLVRDPEVDRTAAALIAWDVGLVFFLVSAAAVIIGADADAIRSRAEEQDVGRYAILLLTTASAVASLAGIYAEVIAASGWRLGLAVGTIFLSWFFVQFIFAVHYAHEFYKPSTGEPGGLTFPGKPSEPDYGDFLYFAFVIGMTSQVSDVAVTAQRIRRTVTLHGLFAFFFNVALVALVVGIVANKLRAG